MTRATLIQPGIKQRQNGRTEMVEALGVAVVSARAAVVDGLLEAVADELTSRLTHLHSEATHDANDGGHRCGVCPAAEGQQVPGRARAPAGSFVHSFNYLFIHTIVH